MTKYEMLLAAQMEFNQTNNCNGGKNEKGFYRYSNIEYTRLGMHLLGLLKQKRIARRYSMFQTYDNENATHPYLCKLNPDQSS